MRFPFKERDLNIEQKNQIMFLFPDYKTDWKSCLGAGWQGDGQFSLQIKILLLFASKIRDELFKILFSKFAYWIITNELKITDQKFNSHSLNIEVFMVI